MSVNAGIFGDGTSLESRYIRDHKKLATLVKYWKDMGLKVVLTSGTFDLFHIGHAEYLERAKAMGDILIVGVDSDAKVRDRKGPHRPVVSEEERVGILSHVRHVDVITLKGAKDPKNNLIKLLRPDVLVLSKSTKHKKEDAKEKGKYCGKVVELMPQSATSTSAKVRLLHTTGADTFAKELIPHMNKLVERELADGSRELAIKLAAQIPGIIEDVLKKVREQK